MILRCTNPDALTLMAPGAFYETLVEPGRNGLQQVFAHHPRTLQGLYRVASANPSRRLVEHDGVGYSANDIFASAAGVAAWLRAKHNIQAGETVAIALPNSAAFIATFIAVTSIGAVAVLVNTRGAAEEMLRAIDMMECRIVFADADRAAALLADRPAPQWPIVIDGDAPQCATGHMRFAEIVADPAPPGLNYPDSDPDDGAIVLFTSGTTGFPKAVVLSHLALTHAAVMGGLVADIQDIAYTRTFGVDVPSEKRSASAATVIATPCFHMGGVLPLLRGLYFHAPLFLMTRWNVQSAFGLMERETVTRLGFVPTMLLDMIRSPLASQDNLGKIMVLSNGSASLDPVIVAEIRDKMPQVMLANSYGQTESAGWATSICGSDYLEHPTSAGYILPTLEMRIVRADRSDANIGEHGEILVRGAGIMREYHGAPDATQETVADGWLHTGDIGSVDDAGRLFIADRKKNMVISGGENIYCAEVERVIGDYPAIAEVIAYGRPDERLGERITVTIVPRGEALVDLDALRSYARTRLAGYKVPRDIFLRADPLPRTPTMKIDRGTFLRSL